MENTNINLPATLDASGLENIFKSAPGILYQNTDSSGKAVAAATTLINNAEKVGMSDKLDEQMAIYIVKAKKTVELLNERRKPFTQLISKVQTQFTGLENSVKQAVEAVQKLRDNYATEKMRIQKEKERIEALRLEKERLTIEMKKHVASKVADNFLLHLKEAKEILLNNFNSLTLETVETAKDDLLQYTDEITDETYLTFAPVILNPAKSANGVTFTVDEMKAMAEEYMNGNRAAFTAQYKAEIAALKRELIDKLPSKQAELEATAKAETMERERLEREKAEREKAERERIEREAAEAKQRLASKIEIKAAGETAEAIVNSQASIDFSTKPNVKDGYQIEIKNSTGWLLIVQFWFEHEGKSLTNAKIEKYTFERMKRFCESHALKYEEKIVSPSIEYKIIYKAK
jgi:hypothetical protein